MSEMIELTKLRLVEGVWHGALRHKGSPDWAPKIEVTHLDFPVDGVEVEQDRVEECWYVRVPIPADRISDGVQTFVIAEAATGEVLNSFAVMVGEALGDDIRSELDLLRAELDLLKKAFRRHCVETSDPE